MKKKNWKLLFFLNLEVIVWKIKYEKKLYNLKIYNSWKYNFQYFRKKKLIYNFQIKKINFRNFSDFYFIFRNFFMIFNFLQIFIILKNNFQFFLNYMACHINVTWPKLHSQQLPRGIQHAKSTGMWSLGHFSNNIFFAGM